MLALALLPAPVAHAISGNEQVELAGRGRFDELAKRLEILASKRSLPTADLHALCFAYSKLKNYTKLFSCLDTLEQQARNGDVETRLLGLDNVTSTIETMRAEAFIDLGQYHEATDSARRALAWNERELIAAKDIEINALAALSIAYGLSGERNMAEIYAAKLKQVDVSWPLNNVFANTRAYALARVNLGLGHYDKALRALTDNKNFGIQVFLDNFLSGATISGKSNWVWQELPRSYMVTKSLMGLGRRAEAREGYDHLLKIKEAAANGEIYWLILYDRGRIAEDENSFREAIDLYARAIDVIETQRASINTETSKIGFIGNKTEVYGHIIELLLKTGETGRALEYLERSKSRALVDMLATKTAAPDFLGPSPDNRPALTAYLKADDEVRLQPPLKNGIDERRKIAVREAEQLRQVAPEMASLVKVDKIPVSRIQSLLGKDETLVQYYLHGENSFAFVLTVDTLKAFSLGAVDKDIERFREAMQKRHPRVLEFAQQLYGRLIAPFAPELKTTNLLLVPHGSLHYLSFAALHDGKRFLVDHFGLRTLPSASVLEYIRVRRAPAGAPILIFGNPDQGEKNSLPSAEAEAKIIARNAPKSRLLLGRSASETAFVEEAGDYPLVHIASHGEFKPNDPLASALLLAQDEKNDGRLTVAELYAVKLNADLVTLSACETGVGELASGDDVVGLTRGLLFAGTSSIIGSLWKVDDRATSYLMERFYAQLAHSGKREALRVAQLDTKKRFSHPFFWAPFYLIGSEQ